MSLDDCIILRGVLAQSEVVLQIKVVIVGIIIALHALKETAVG